MPRPLLPIAVLFLVGAAIGPLDAGPAVGGAALVLAVGCLRGRAPMLRLAAVLLGLAAAAAGASLPAPAERSAVGARSAPRPLVAALAERPRLGREGWRALAVVEGVPGEALLAAPGPAPAVGAGARVALLGRLSPMAAPANPGAGGSSSGGVRAGPVPGTPVVPVRAAGEPAGAGATDRLQRALLEAVDQGLPGPHARVLGAMLLGEPGRLEPAQRDPFVETGTAHLLAISGLHLGLVAAVLLRLLEGVLRRAPSLASRGQAIRIAAAVTVLACTGFTALSGWHLPTRRALVMVALHLGARAIGRRADGPTSLAAAALVIVALEPGAVHELGFQLSFAAVGGLLLGASTGQALEQRVPGDGRLRRAGRALVLLAWTSWVAWLATAPLVLWHFGACPLLAPPINAVAVPLLGLVVMPLALATVPLAALLPAAPTLWPLRVALGGLLDLVGAAAPHALPATGAVAWAALALAAGATAWVALRAAAPGRRLRWPSRAIAAATAGGVATALLAGAPARGDLVVAFLDVGHGDAAVIRLPDGTGIVVDGGGRHGDGGATGRRVVLPALRALGVTRLRAVVLTHPDADHLLGLLPVVAAMPPDALWWSGHVVRSPTQLALVATALAGGTRLREVGAATPGAVLGGVHLDVLGPEGTGTPSAPGTWVPGRGTNDSSVVLRLRYGRVSFLLPGDAEVAQESALVGGGRLGAVTVLKAPHHGSTTSSTPPLVAATRPAHVVVSCDEHGRHGLPKAAVLARWAAAGARVHRTDRSGAVVFRTDGQRLAVSHGR